MTHGIVFIVGLPRTGSTLLRYQLNQSERVCIAPETHFLRNYSRYGAKKRLLAFGDLAQQENVDRFLDHIFVDHGSDARNYWGWVCRNFTREAFRQRLLETGGSDQAIFTLLFTAFAEKQLGGLPEDVILGEKTPTNLYYVPRLLEWYPQAKVIHTIRDPRATFVSAAKRARSGGLGFRQKLPPLPERLSAPALNTMMLAYVSRAWFAAQRLHDAYGRRYPGQYETVRFEDLVSQPQDELQRICRFLGIPFEERMVDEVKMVGSSFSAQRVVADAGFDRSAAVRWQAHIHPLVRGWFSLVGRGSLKKFGYVP